MKLRKIPLEPLLEILKQLYDDGADFIDLSGETGDESKEKRDVIKITVKPEYLIDNDEEVYMDYTDSYEDDVNIYTVEEKLKNNDESFSDNDVNDLI
jgi:uncharacterized protein YifE (UPF0438 family)